MSERDAPPRDRRFAALTTAAPHRVVSRVRRIVGLEIEAGHVHAAIGDLVWIGDARRPAEVVAIRDDAVVMMPFGSVEGIAAGDAVEASGLRPTLDVGNGLIGRVVDATGRPIDGLGPVAGLLETVDYANDVPNPMTRAAHLAAVVARRARRRHDAHLRAGTAHRDHGRAPASARARCSG